MLKKKNLRLSGQRPDIHDIAKRITEKYSISIGELRSGGKRRAVVKARRAVSWIGVRELGYSGDDIARCLGVTTSCINRIIATGIIVDIDDIISDL